MQLKRVMKLCKMFNLVQVNHVPTRDNSLDIALLAEMEIKYFFFTKLPSISHHNIMEGTTTYHLEMMEINDIAEDDVC